METVRKLVNEAAKADCVLGTDLDGVGVEVAVGGTEKVVIVVLSLAIGIAHRRPWYRWCFHGCSREMSGNCRAPGGFSSLDKQWYLSFFVAPLLALEIGVAGTLVGDCKYQHGSRNLRADSVYRIQQRESRWEVVWQMQ